MDEAIAHCDLLCCVRQGSLFPGCMWIAAGHVGKDVLGLQMLSELDLVTFNSALSQQIRFDPVVPGQCATVGDAGREGGMPGEGISRV